MRCDEVLGALDEYLDDALDGPRRDALRTHLRSCGRCRDAAIGRDPSLLFVVARPSEPDSARIEETTRAVVAQIRQQRLQRRLGRRPRPWLAAAAMLLLSLTAVVGWRLLAPGNGSQAPAGAEIVVADSPSPPPRIEVDMSGEGVRVYQYADSQDSDTAVTFIVNPELEL
jgi:hypothetical protein